MTKGRKRRARVTMWGVEDSETVDKGKGKQSQVSASSPPRRITRALASASPGTGQQAPPPLTDTPFYAPPQKKRTGSAKKKDTSVKEITQSSLLVRLHAIRNEWQMEHDAAVRRSMQPTNEGDTDDSVRAGFNVNLTKEHEQQRVTDAEGEEPGLAAASDIIQHEEEPAVPLKKTGRGPARMPKGWGEQDNHLMVYLDQGYVIGPQVNEYKTAIGCLARDGDKLPLNYAKFNDIPEHYRDGAWKEVQHNTTLGDDAKTIVLKDLKQGWRQWKHYIKANYFIPHKDDEAYLSRVPTERIKPEQWAELVQYWKDDRVEELAKKNSANGYKTNVHHRLGRKSFVVLANELKSQGKQMANLDLWVESRRCDKRVEDGSTSNVMEHFNPELGKTPQEQRTSLKDEIFTHKRKRGLVKALVQSPPSAFLNQSEEVQRLVEEMLKEVREIKEIKAEIANDKLEMKMEVKKMELVADRWQSTMNISGLPLQGPQPLLASSTTQHAQVRNLDVFQHTSQIGAQVKLLSLGIPKVVVAEGVIVSLPQTGDNLGLVKICIAHVIKPNEGLFSPTRGGATMMGEAIEQVVEWPLECVLYV